MIGDQRETGYAILWPAQFSSRITLSKPFGRLPSATTQSNEAVV